MTCELEEFIAKWRMGLNWQKDAADAFRADLEKVVAAEADTRDARRRLIEQRELHDQIDSLRAWARDAASDLDAAEDALRAAAGYAPGPEHRQAIACANRIAARLKVARDLGLLEDKP